MVINFGVVCHLYESLQIGETRLKDFINLQPSETTWWRRRRRPAAASTSGISTSTTPPTSSTEQEPSRLGWSLRELSLGETGLVLACGIWHIRRNPVPALRIHTVGEPDTRV